MSNVPLGPIDLPELSRNIEEAMANLSPEQIAEFRRTFGAQEPTEPVSPVAPTETEEARIARLDREQRQAEFEATQAAERAAVSQRRENAFGIVAGFLQRAGLAGLETNIRGLLAQGVEDSDAILFNLRETPQFKTRFKANARRAADGLPELDPATSIGLEKQYATVLRSNNLPTEFYDSPDDFAALIEGDVSPAEFQGRIQEGLVKIS